MDSPASLQAIRRDQEIDGWRVRVYFWSRDIRLLSAIAAIIFALAAGLGWFVRSPASPKAPQLHGSEEQFSLREELVREEPDPLRIFAAMAAQPFSFEDEKDTGSPEEWIENSKLTAQLPL